VGFDVVGLTNEYSLSQQIIAFNPDLIIAAGQSGKVSAGGVGRRLKETPRWHGKAVLIFPANHLPEPKDLLEMRLDLVLEAPVFTERLLQVICKLLGHNESVILDRLHKSAHGDASQRSSLKTVSGGFRFSTEKETIYVSGNVSEQGASGVREKAGSGKEFRINEDTSEHNFSFHIENHVDASEQKSTENRRVEEVSNSTDSLIGRVSAKVDDSDLIGGGIPPIERIEQVSAEKTTQEKTDFDIVIGSMEGSSLEQRAHKDLQAAQERAKARIAKYSEMTKDIKVNPISTIQKTEARRKQKEMFADVDRQAIEDIDKQKRDFAKALFKK
jgi:hypothetical protein